MGTIAGLRAITVPVRTPPLSLTRVSCTSPSRSTVTTGTFLATSPRTSSTSTSTTTPGSPPENAATVIQGPSLLTNTGRYRPSPSLLFLPGLRSLPFWTAPSTNEKNAQQHRIAYNDPVVSHVVNLLEQNYQVIKNEYINAVLGSSSDNNSSNDKDKSKAPSSTQDFLLTNDYDVNSKGGEHADDALHIGQWDWHSYILHGEFPSTSSSSGKSNLFAQLCPQTAQIIQQIHKKNLLFVHNPFGFSFFSTLYGNSRIKAHVGPTNLRLRVHLPLIVPTSSSSNKRENDNSSPNSGSNNIKNHNDTSFQQQEQEQQKNCGIRVGDQIRLWDKEGQALVLDDSYEHEVWNDTPNKRVLLLVDIWHPDVSTEEKNRIVQMFDYARTQGWIGRATAGDKDSATGGNSSGGG